MRALAIVLVLITHFWSYLPQTIWINRLAAAGWVGVDLFFVLSGYLISGILLDTRAEPRYFVNFYARRALRIFPPYYLLLLIVLGVLPLVHPGAELIRARRDLAWFALYASNLYLAAYGWRLFLLDITWSLAIEEQFYFIWPTLVRWLSPRRLLRACIALVVLLPFVRASLVSGLGLSWRWAHMMMPLRCDEFAFGALIAMARREQWGDWATLRRWAPMMLVVLSTVIFTLILSGRFGRDSSLVAGPGYSLLGLTAALFIVIAVQPPRVVGAVLRWAPLRHIGKVSYGMYLYHPLVRVTASLLPLSWLAAPRGTLTAVINMVVLSAATVAAATISYRWFESPVLGLKRHFERH